MRVPFPVDQVRKNPQGLDYVAIDGYINRLLDVLGLDYDFRVIKSDVVLLPPELSTSSGKRQYLAQVTGELTIHGDPVVSSPNSSGFANVIRRATTRAGVGADVSFDPDKALKTAQAEALKKSAHQFGIALELWDAEHRKSLERKRNLTTPTAYKREVWKIARKRLDVDKPSAAQVAKAFGRKAAELSEPEVLRQILVDEGVLDA